MILNDELRNALFTIARTGEPSPVPELIRIGALDHFGRLTGYGSYCLVRNGWSGATPHYYSQVRQPMPKRYRGVGPAIDTGNL